MIRYTTCHRILSHSFSHLLSSLRAENKQQENVWHLTVECFVTKHSFCCTLFHKRQFLNIFFVISVLFLPVFAANEKYQVVQPLICNISLYISHAMTKQKKIKIIFTINGDGLSAFFVQFTEN